MVNLISRMVSMETVWRVIPFHGDFIVKLVRKFSWRKINRMVSMETVTVWRVIPFMVILW